MGDVGNETCVQLDGQVTVVSILELIGHAASLVLVGPPGLQVAYSF
jgi:hypothetical protein